MRETCFILMWLEGPLQSWGVDSRFFKKNTLEFPSKSGLLGMLCCAMGASGEQREWLATMAPLKTTVLAYSKGKAVPLLRDFHMIGAGYNEENPFEAQMMPRKSDGGKPVGGGAKVTYRYYLQDAVFAAILEVPTAESERLSQALINPVWDLFLGRKNCTPSDFIFRGVFQTEGDAYSEASRIAVEKSLKEKFKVLDRQFAEIPAGNRVEDIASGLSEKSPFAETESAPKGPNEPEIFSEKKTPSGIAGQFGENESIVLNDVPVEFGQNKKYKQRYVTIQNS